MVTIAVKKGGRIDIVADAWHLEQDCKSPHRVSINEYNVELVFLGHYEWHLAFPLRTVDMTSLRATFNDSGTLLTISVRKAGALGRMYA